MRYSQRWNSYNFRRYSKPWIAVVTGWKVGSRPDIEWGGYIGSDSGGETEIECEPGSIIRAGQRDHRGNNTVNNWYYAMRDGSLLEVTEVQARMLYDGRVSLDAVVNDREREQVERQLAEARRAVNSLEWHDHGPGKEEKLEAARSLVSKLEAQLEAMPPAL